MRKRDYSQSVASSLPENYGKGLYLHLCHIATEWNGSFKGDTRVVLFK